MSMKVLQKIAVSIENPVQFYSVEPLLKAMEEENLEYDIILPDWGTPDFQIEGWHAMGLELENVLNQASLPFLRAPVERIYTVSMSPYPLWWEVKSVFKVAYRYGYVLKDFDIAPENNVPYDVILCYGDSDSDFLSAYAKTCSIGEPKLLTYKKGEQKSTKKTLLWLPTYGEFSSIQGATSILSKLSNQYNILVKAHHGVNFLKDEEERRDLIDQTFGQTYNCSKPLYELLAEADVVLSDNSGAIYDALAAGVPVARFTCKEPNNKNGFVPYYIELAKCGTIPSTNDPNEISAVVEKAMLPKIYRLQRKAAMELYLDPEEGKRKFISLMLELMHASERSRYYALQCSKNEYYDYNKKENEDLKHTIENVKSLAITLNDRKSYKLLSLFDKFIKFLMIGKMSDKQEFLALCVKSIKEKSLSPFMQGTEIDLIMDVVESIHF